MAGEKPFYPLMGIVIASAAFVDKISQTQPHKVNSLIIRELPKIVTRVPSTIFYQITTFIPLYLTFIKIMYIQIQKQENHIGRLC